MVSRIPPPDPLSLLPPLLACLPIAFVSPRPPPALLPLLSPILRQRVTIHSQSAAPSDSWLPLLCWDPQRAAKLPGVVENIQIEPHPVSGEIEIEEVEATKFRRLDEETLHVRFDAEHFNLCFLFLWCVTDEQGGGSAWRLAELRALEDGDDGAEWFDSIAEADENCGAGQRRGAQQTSGATNGTLTVDNTAGEDDDDDYWASYDRTPGRTPAKRSPAPNSSSVQMPSNSELEYFARYMAEVQPAMDPHDPSEEGVAPGESSLNGNELLQHRRMGQDDTTNLGQSGYDSSIPLPYTNGSRHDSTRGADDDHKDTEMEHPRPSSSASSGSVDKLEQSAESQTQAELAIKQHISTDLKSLFRLARTAGIDRAEFERIVRTELECLSLMDLDE